MIVDILAACAALLVADVTFAASRCEKLFFSTTSSKMEPSYNAKKTPASVRPANYLKVEHVPFRGMEHLAGQKTNVGKLTHITFATSGNTQQLMGRIVREYVAGIDIVDASGVNHKINVNSGEIFEVYVEPKEYNWLVPEYAATKAQLLKTVASLGNPFGLVSIKDGSRDVDLYGELSIVEIGPGYRVLSLRDHNNNVHIFDPDYVGENLMLLQNTPESRQIFPSLFSPHRIEIVDTRRQSRKTLISQLAEEGRVYDNPKYYDYLVKDISDTKKLILRWFSDDGKYLIDSFVNNLGERFVVLLTDPGIAQRAKEFVAFGVSILRSRSDVTPWQLREMFSAKLGKTRVFRGMVLTEVEKDSMLKEGIEAPGFKNDSGAKRSLFDTFGSLALKNRARYATDPRSEVEARLMDTYDADKRMYISVSKYQEIASSVGFHSSDAVGGNNRRLYVFELDVPELSILRQERLFQKDDRYGKHEVFVTVGSNFSVSETNDLGLEMFIPYKIDPADIVGVNRYESPPPRWERNFRRDPRRKKKMDESSFLEGHVRTSL